MTENATVQLITLDDLVSLKDQLRVLHKGWMNDLVDEIRKVDPLFKESRVYNLLNNQVTHQEHRRLFIEAGTRLLISYKEKQENTIKVMNGDIPPEEIDISIEEKLSNSFDEKLKRIAS